jgi:hypothetical protein
MTRFSARTRLRHGPGYDQNGRVRAALRAALGSLFVFLTMGSFSIHGHVAAQHADGSFSITSAGEEAPGPLHGHTPADLIDCQICESNRRAEVDDCVLWVSLTVMVEADGRRLLVEHSTSVPLAPSRGRPSPRAPPTFSA